MPRRVRPKYVPLLVALAERQLSARMFAVRAGLHPATISAIINRRVDPKPATRSRIARALNLSVHDLFPAEEVAR